jgi:hypothetical protein
MIRSPRRLAIQGVLVALLLLVAIPAYFVLEQAWRPLALRIAGAIVVITGCTRVTRRVRRSAEAGSPSALDARPPAPPDPELDGRFLRLRDDIVFSTRSRRYFEAGLWPRLLALAGPDLPRPPERRGLLRRVGPSLAALERLLAEVERRR